jgi:4-cresol dehydrogenase (hydroxylating) flavoprotein subunit
MRAHPLPSSFDSASVVPVFAYGAALGEWVSVLGEEYVIDDSAVLSGAGAATFHTTASVKAILRPGTREEVQEVVRIANRHRVPIYPFSSGKNWGYGSRAPVQTGVLVDLGRLNRIIDFDEDLAYVTVEPGVTQRQLYEFLQARRSRLWMDATGASPDCSIIGNTLERGFGHTPMGDHCANACGLEVVLPTGEIIETGFSRFGGATTAAIGRWGVGPSLDGLFSQSSLGIVTRMSLWLMPAPEAFQAFFFSCKDPAGLPAIIDSLRPLRMNGTLRSISHIGNDYKVVSAAGQYPWEDMRHETPLGREAMARVRKKLGIGTWNGSGGLYGTRAQVREARRQVRRALKGKVDRLQFVDDRLLALMARFATPFRLLTGWDIKRTLKVIAPVYNLLKGVPTSETMASTYWRKKTPPSARPDPDRDGCGLLWCSPVVPNTGAHVAAVTQLASDVLLTNGFEPQISLSLATERTVICVITISYDRAVPGQDEQALACYRVLTEQLLARGYPPYRLNVGSMEYLARDAQEYASALRALKKTLDPRGILAPGRYDAAPTSAAEPSAPAFLKAGTG